MNDERERDIYVKNETYTHEKRVIIMRQKRPMHMTKETEMHDDRERDIYVTNKTYTQKKVL